MFASFLKPRCYREKHHTNVWKNVYFQNKEALWWFFFIGPQVIKIDNSTIEFFSFRTFSCYDQQSSWNFEHLPYNIIRRSLLQCFVTVSTNTFLYIFKSRFIETHNTSQWPTTYGDLRLKNKQKVFNNNNNSGHSLLQHYGRLKSDIPSPFNCSK